MNVVFLLVKPSTRNTKSISKFITKEACVAAMHTAFATADQTVDLQKETSSSEQVNNSSLSPRCTPPGITSSYASAVSILNAVTCFHHGGVSTAMM
jgi:hypothetical protein